MKILVVGKHNVMNWPETVYQTLRATNDCRLFITNHFPLSACLLNKKARQENRANALAKQVAEFKPDVVLCISPFLLPLSILQACRSATSALFVGWVADVFKAIDEFKALHLDALFCTDTGFLQEAKKLCPAFYLPLCANADIFRPIERPAYQEPFFVGQANPERMRYLQHCPTPCQIYGKGWDKKLLSQHAVHNKKLSLTQAATFIQKSLCPLNMAFSPNNVDGINFRVFELGAARKVILTSACADLEKCYTPGKEALAYNSPEELADWVAKITRNPSQYTAIAQAGYERTLKEHTYPQRLQQWADMIRTL